MTSKFELMLSDYTPELNQEKQMFHKQRKKIYKILGAIGIIILAFMISSIVLAIHCNLQDDQLKVLQNDIERLKTHINDLFYNKRLQLNSTNILDFKLSGSSTSSKKIKSINLTDHNLIGLEQTYIQSLEELYLGNSKLEQQHSKPLFRINECYFPNLKKIEFPYYFTFNQNYFGIEEFPFVDGVTEFSQNIFPNIKKMVFQNADVRLDNFFLNSIRSVQELYFINTTSFNIHNTLAPNLRILTIVDTKNVLQSISIMNTTKMEKLSVTSNNFLQFAVQNVSNINEQYLKIPRVKRLSFVHVSFVNFTLTYKQLATLHLQHDYLIESIDISRFPKMVSMLVANSSLKYLLKTNNQARDSLSIIQLRYTLVESISNFVLEVVGLTLRANPYLKQICNNTFSRLYSIQLPQNIVKIQNNKIGSLLHMSDVQGDAFFTSLAVFDGNYLAKLQSLYFPYSQLSSMQRNTFMYLTTVNLSNANFNDQAIINLMEKNKFQMPNILIEFDIRNNPIVDKQGIQAKLQQLFQNAEIYI